MSKHTDAADAIRRMAKQYEQMVVAADILDQIGSLDNAAKEAQALVATSQAEAAVVKAELAKMKDALKDAKAQAKEVLADAEEKAEKALTEANIKAGILVNNATERAETIRVSVQEGLAADEKAAQARADVLAALIEERQKKAAEINEKVADAEARLEKAEKQMASMKAKLASLVD